MPFDYRPHLDWIAEQLDTARKHLIRLSDINSGSFNADGVSRVADYMQELMQPLGAVSQRLPVAAYASVDDRGQGVSSPLGPALSLRQRPDSPLQVFLCGHLDTVFAADHPFQRARQTDDDTLHGPGVADLKGGLLVMWLALAALERSPWRESVGWEVLLNPDEEIGSQGSAPLLAEAAARNRFGLVFEPSFPDGNLAGQRRGSGNFDVVVRGRAAHAGREHHLGRNAVRACADLVSALDDLNGARDGITVNPAYVHGGGATNVVPDLCTLRFNVRTEAAEDETWMRAQLDALLSELDARDGIRAELHGGFTRPPKPFTGATAHLASLITDCGRALELELSFHPTGGCCDGNNLAAAGLPNIDNLGVVGGAIHSDQEYMRISSIAERAQLSALLLMRLASGELQWN